MKHVLSLKSIVAVMAFCLWFPELSRATPVNMTGSTSWQQNTNQVTIHVDRISNNSSTGTSGSLRLRLWATATRYAGGTISGYVLGVYQFSQTLGPGQYYSNVQQTVPFTTPPAGTYYTTLTLEEYTGNWVIQSYVTYPNTHTWSGSSGSELTISGTTSWQQDGDALTIHVDTVSNTGTGTSGSLRLELWATASKYSGGTISGYILGTYAFRQALGPNQSYTNVTQTVPFTTPPNGTYYTTLTLEQYTGSGWVIEDYLTYNSTFTWPTGGGGGGGGGGMPILNMSGTTAWLQNGTLATIHVEQISNSSPTATSGSLRLEVWATSTPYAGGTIRGYVLASYQLPQVLGPNRSFSNVTEVVPFQQPPDGTYNTTLALEQYSGSTWYIEDYVTYNNTTTFGPNGGGGGGNGGGGNGGGSPALQSFSFPDRGGASFTTNGASSGTPENGYARIQPNAGSSTPPGVAIFSYRSHGVLVSEAGVPASPLIRTGRIYAEYNGPVNTGVTIANPNNQPVTISFYFTRSDGADFGASTTTIAANGQLDKFLSEPPFNSGSFQGTFTFSSSLPVSVVALRGYTNERGDFLITTLPVNTVSTASNGTIQTPPPPITLPHFADGGGWTTQVILVNPADFAITGSIQFLDENGQVTNITANGQTGSMFPYAIPRRSSFRLSTSGIGGGITGSVRVSPLSGSVQPGALSVFSYRDKGITVSEAGVPVISGTAFRMYAESGSGIGIANTSPSPALVRLELTRLDGSSTSFSTNVTIPPQGHIARFLLELFPSITVGPPYFQGVLRISSVYGSGLAVVGLRGRYNERNDFLITTTPLASETAPPTTGEMLFPLLVNGGGYATQFILFSGYTGQSASGNLQIVKQDGSPFPLSLTSNNEGVTDLLATTDDDRRPLSLEESPGGQRAKKHR